MTAPKSTSETKPSDAQDLIVSSTMGLVVFCSIAFVIYRLGVDVIESILFALISGVAAAAFILRERSLMNRLTAAEKRHMKEVGILSERIERAYGSPSINLVQFNAGSLIVDRASVGFLDLIEAAAERNVRGQRLEELLGVEATALERVIDDIRSGTVASAQVLECRPSVGTTFSAKITGHYLEDSHSLEAALQPVIKKPIGAGEADRAMADLERFRQGMARREYRILELKGEVNDLLKQTGHPPRYRVDHRTESPFEEKLTVGERNKEDLPNG